MARFVNPRRVFAYQYRCEDRSLISPHFRKHVCLRLLRLVPRFCSPNLLSLAANSASFLVFFFLIGAFGPVDQMAQTSRLAFLIPAVGIFIYVALDNTDGLQARRTSVSSPLGDFLDHWFDSFAAFMIPLGFLMALKAEDWRMLSVVVFGIASFWVANWEMMHCGVLKLPPVGELEGNMLAIVTHLLTAILGLAFWQTRLLGVTLLDVLTLIALAGFGSATAVSLLRCRAERWQMLGLVASVGLIMLWYSLTLSRNLLPLRNHPLVPIVVGLIGVKHIGDLQRNFLIGTAYRVFDIGFLVLGTGLVASLFIEPLRQSNIQLRLLFVVLLYAIGTLVYQLWHTSAFVTQALGINVLTLTATQKAALQRSAAPHDVTESARP